MTDVPLDRFAAAVSGLIAGQIVEVLAPLQRRCCRTSSARAACCTVCAGVPSCWWAISGTAGSVVMALLYAVFFHILAAADHLMAWRAVEGLVHLAIGGLIVTTFLPVADPQSVVAGLRRVGFGYACYGRRDVLTYLSGRQCSG